MEKKNIIETIEIKEFLKFDKEIKVFISIEKFLSEESLKDFFNEKKGYEKGLRIGIIERNFKNYKLNIFSITFSFTDLYNRRIFSEIKFDFKKRIVIIISENKTLIEVSFSDIKIRKLKKYINFLIKNSNESLNLITFNRKEKLKKLSLNSD